MLIGSLWAGRAEDTMKLQAGSLFRAPKYDFELPQAKKNWVRRRKELSADPIFPIKTLTEGNIFVLPIGPELNDVYFKYRGQMIVFTQGSYAEGDLEKIKAKSNAVMHKNTLEEKWDAIRSHFIPHPQLTKN